MMKLPERFSGIGLRHVRFGQVPDRGIFFFRRTACHQGTAQQTGPQDPAYRTDRQDRGKRQPHDLHPIALLPN